MQHVRPGLLQSEINVTPLVDVVLVLLIIFMILAPQMVAGPAVSLPTTERPPRRSGDGERLVVGIERGGALWIDDRRVSEERFQARIQQIARRDLHREVVIRGDAGLSFGEVRQAMLAIESAGFKRVGLIAEQGRSK